MEVDKKLLEDCYHLIEGYTDDMGFCLVCTPTTGGEEHLRDCWKQETLEKLRALLNKTS